MRLFFYIILILMPLRMAAKTSLATANIVDEHHILQLLDSYVDRRDDFVKQKEAKINKLKLKLRTADNNTSRLAILNSIYHEYYTYSYDSAMVYVNRGLDLALAINNPHYTTLNRINRAAVALHAYLSGELAFMGNPLSKTVLKLYTAALDNSPVDSRVHASAAYCVARYYREMGDMLLYEKYIVEAAISDMVCPLKENLALQEFSTYLYKKDPKYADRAARYIYCSMEDARFYNNRLRMLEISNILPIIATANQEALAHKERIVRGVLAVVSFLSLVLFAMAIFGYKQNKWLVRSRREVKSQNRQLTELNEKLIATNHRRETYMRLFMDISAVYIRKLLEYRKLVSRKIKANQTADLLKTINSYRLAEEEATTFYTRFDRAFIELYPGFVDELNGLLLPEAKIAQPSPNSLTTEARIFALMRLGVTDSQEIATLLFYSTQTIYNYKSAMRTRAINRDTFDEDINRLCHVG